jgi:hypothetical protein
LFKEPFQVVPSFENESDIFVSDGFLFRDGRDENARPIVLQRIPNQIKLIISPLPFKSAKTIFSNHEIGNVTSID